jgi:fucose 4-O-acetylase-like acetyltransferase
LERIHFVQWIRVFLISLVVAHHAAQPYGPTGGEWPVDDPVTTAWLGPFFGLNAAYFMGFFFLIAGYFTPGAHDRKGGAAFVRDRLTRLGIPLLVFAFLVFPVVGYALGDSADGFPSFYLFTYLGRWQIEMGHLWFVAQLLVFGLLYAMWRRFGRPGEGAHGGAPSPPGERAILLYAVALGVVGALVRSFYPQDDWVRILWLIPAEPAHLPQYASLFVIGLMAGRGGWFRTISSAIGIRWFLIGVVAFVLAGSRRDIFPFLDPELSWGFLEAFVCVGMILGLTAFFRRYCDKPSRLLDRLDSNVYGVYLLHIFVVVALQMAILDVALSATAKFLIVTALGLPITFALSTALRSIPAVRRVV